jgi:hypothetical protein
MSGTKQLVGRFARWRLEKTRTCCIKSPSLKGNFYGSDAIQKKVRPSGGLEAYSFGHSNAKKLVGKME